VATGERVIGRVVSVVRAPHQPPEDPALITQPPPIPLGMPEAEVAIDAERVRGLLRAQHPDLADLPIALLAEGWDTVTFRIGEDLLARLPRRAIVGVQIVNEHVWLPRLAPRLPVPIPAPVRIGAPQGDYPWPWSVLPYFPGATIGDAPLDRAVGTTFGEFLRALHHTPPADAPTNPYRGGPLAARRDGYNDRAKGLAARLSLPRVVDRIWDAGVEAPIDVAPTWLHGDLHPLNVLMDDGRLSAVIDWIDICAGDRATDLAALWALPFTADARAAALAAYGGVSDATLARARAWAAYFGVVHLSSGLANAPRHARIGERILQTLAEDVRAA
jgi:aminoglycoside phosphotransferase (APT) family kinase protein